MTRDYEKLGVFYLGRIVDPESGAETREPLLYDSRDLTTHAVCVGMTGSGKTGLCVGLLEEAAIDGIPVLAIDPKGDLGNLLLTFPELRTEDFRPWVDADEAARQGQAVDAFAAATAGAWRKGLADWDQEPERIARLRAAADMTIYTPGSAAGEPLSILRSFAAPGADVGADGAALTERISAAVCGLLGLVGIAADPVRSREHILLSNILAQAWRAGRDMDLPALIAAIQKPGFDKVGVMDLETFYPGKERMELAMALNNLLAAPGFAAWLEGKPLDIQRMLYTPEGKPRIAIVSIAHLSDAERMFVVTLLLTELLAWMRDQAGTTSLRALLYMDEIFGYFPPSAMPPSKLPMLTLLKQARAFGVGIVLSTQNPVDLDYKGLANAGTWLIGRLQTDRDRDRVMDGLEGALAGSGGFDRAALERMMARAGKRTFLMHNVNEDRPVLFRTRWTLSYLRGPMTPRQIQEVMDGRRGEAHPGREVGDGPRGGASSREPVFDAAGPGDLSPSRPPAPPPGINEYFIKLRPPGMGGPTYAPGVVGNGQLHFVDAKAGVDAWVSQVHVAPLPDDGRAFSWDEATRIEAGGAALMRAPEAEARFEALPAAGLSAKNYPAWGKALATWWYRNVTLELPACPALKAVGKPGESEGDFRARIALAVRERRDAAVDKLRRQYAAKVPALQEQLRKAEARVEAEKSQMGQQAIQTAISIGATVLGAFFGRKAMSVGNLGRATTAVRGAGRTIRERGDMQRAGETVAVLQERLASLQAEIEAGVARIQAENDPGLVEIVTVTVRPRKSDITVSEVALAWMG
jgi:hypothetical protein